jgi:hypothetical protein
MPDILLLHLRVPSSGSLLHTQLCPLLLHKDPFHLPLVQSMVILVIILAHPLSSLLSLVLLDFHIATCSPKQVNAIDQKTFMYLLLLEPTMIPTPPIALPSAVAQETQGLPQSTILGGI